MSPVIAVIVDLSVTDALKKLGAIVLLNRKSYEGISTSIRSGVSAAQGAGAGGVVVMTCDQIALTPAHLRALIDEPAVITGSGYRGRTGMPAYFPAAAFADFLKLEGDVGARDLLRGARVVLADELALDIDTEADVVRAREALGLRLQ